VSTCYALSSLLPVIVFCRNRSDQCMLGKEFALTSGRFRFQATLMAPTTIRKTTGEPPVTYLNSEQTYSVSITDTGSATQGPVPTLYRTSIRIAIEHNSAESWQLWKNRRGTTLDQGQGSTPQAVEYVRAYNGSSAEFFHTLTALLLMDSR
jgi:hypothetical protein